MKAASDRATAIFFALSQAPAGGRARLLDEHCGEDVALREEVERLLRALDLPDSVLTPPSASTAGAQAGISQPAGAVIGDFVVVRQIGAGGTGVVHLAHQRYPPRVVALKTLRGEFLASAVQRRFETEAELLAQLHHPGIAEIYSAHPGDATTPPFIAMELVNGPPLTEFADGRQLSVRDRVDLMARVCDAVQHAHQRGVIHRDLKPGNILVGEDGQPKVLDFGVGRRLEQGSPATIATETGQLVGTIAYMSPEQVLAVPDAIDTRTDIYSLGVILYRLLAGRLPFAHDDPALPELARRIVQDEPPKLGTIDPVLRGDLEVITARALAKEKERRYPSAAGLAADLRRYLEGQPISASADSAWYVVRRQLGRYRLAFGLSAAMLVAVSGLAVYALLQRSRADEINRRLEAQLTMSTIERARLIGMTGNHRVAEELAWRELFRQPDSRHARWTLWEIYSRDPSVWTQIVHQNGTQTVRFSPDGRLLLTSGRVDGLMHLIDVASGRIGRTLTASPSSGTRRAFFSTDGQSIVSGSQDGTLRLWDAATGAVRREVPKAMPLLHDMSVAADANTVLTVAEARAEVWSLSTGTRLADLSPLLKPISIGAINAAGTVAAIGSDHGVVMVVDLKRQAVRWQIAAHAGLVSAIAMSPDERRVVSGGFDGVINVWNAETGALLRTIQAENGRMRNFAFDPGTTTFAAAGQWRTRLFDLDNPLIPVRDIGGAEGTTDVHMTADGRWMATCDGGSGQIRLWDLAPDARTDRWKVGGGAVRGLVVNATEALVAGTNGSEILFWRRGQAEPQLTTKTTGAIYAVDLSHNQRWFVTVGTIGQAAVWDAADGRRLMDLPGVRGSRSVVFADNDRRIYAGEPNGMLRIWNWSGTEATPLLEIPSKDGEPLSLASHGSLVFAGHTNHALVVRDARTGEERRRMKTNAAPFSIAVTPNGRYVAVGTYSGVVDVWEVESGRQLESIKGQTTLVYGLDFSPDGTLLAISSRDGMTRLWDVTAQQPLAVVASRRSAAERVRFLPDSRHLAISYVDGSVEVIDLNHFFRYVAGNAEFQLNLLRQAGETFPRGDDVLAWSRQILAGR